MIQDIDNRFFSFVVSLELKKPSFEHHEFIKLFNGVNATIESNGFNDYKECVTSCNKFFNELAADLNELNHSLKHLLAWESNPKTNSGELPHITPANEWLEGELVRLYLVVNQQGPINNSNLDPVVRGSIFTGKRDTSTSC
jgi:hypothetical protein